MKFTQKCYLKMQYFNYALKTHFDELKCAWNVMPNGNQTGQIYKYVNGICIHSKISIIITFIFQKSKKKNQTDGSFMKNARDWVREYLYVVWMCKREWKNIMAKREWNQTKKVPLISVYLDAVFRKKRWQIKKLKR